MEIERINSASIIHMMSINFFSNLETKNDLNKYKNMLISMREKNIFSNSVIVGLFEPRNGKGISNNYRRRNEYNTK